MTSSSILVRLPNWVGDVVMATPLLMGLRQAFPDAHIALHGRERLFPILEGAEWFDETIGVDEDAGRLQPFRSGLRLRKRRFGTALILPNSFSTALSAYVAGIPRRVGYALDGRRLLLTDPIPVARSRSARAYRQLTNENGAAGDGSGSGSGSGSGRLLAALVGAGNGAADGDGGANGNGNGGGPPAGLREWFRRRAGPMLRPVPMIDYYLKLGHTIGMPEGSVPRRPVLPLGESVRAAGDELLAELGLDPARERIVAFNPGAAYGPAKRWLPEYWAELGDRLAAEHDARVLLLCGPGEEEQLCASIAEQMKQPAVSTAGRVVPLHRLCGLLSHCAALVTTDSGPRHFGVAARIPVVVIVGSTHPGYTESDYPDISVLLERVECWPCHLRTCPIDHRCMTRLTPEKVLQTAAGYLAARSGSGSRG